MKSEFSDTDRTDATGVDASIASEPAKENEPPKLGSFLGVFTPSILTILGVIMYLRFGWVVGNEGLIRTLFIVIIANSITLITAFSVSAVATNMRVGVGGAYYIISRSLGLEIGGAIGIPLFLSQAFSITLYSFGLAESIRFAWPNAPLQTVTAIVIIFITLLSLRGAGLALKAQIPIMIGIALSLISLATGAWKSPPDPTTMILTPSPDSPGFWFVFAVFFPAVTGLLAGISMSGDLRTPQKDIPKGTIAAVMTGFIIYLSVPVLLAMHTDRTALVSDSLIWLRMASIGWLILPGLWGAILSSAIGSILGAPRTLQALAMDRIVPRLFSRRSRSGEPYFAIILSATIGIGAVLLGDINVVAPVLTMFFLTTYGMVNLVAGLERLVGDPSYRPTIRVPWCLSLAGGIACFWVMFLINKFAFFIALLFEIAIYLFLRRRALSVTWGDVHRGVWMALSRTALLRLRHFPEKPRNWRPNILLFAGDIEKRLDLVRFAQWFGQNKGIVTVCNMIEGDIASEIEQVENRLREMSDFIDSRQLMVFPEVHIVDSFETGVKIITQANGIAGLASNTLMFGWSQNRVRIACFLRIMREVSYLHKSMIICRIKPRNAYTRSHTIDLWWGGQQRNGDIMLLLAHLLTLNSEWQNCHVTIKSIARTSEEQQFVTEQFDRMIPELRIDCRRSVLLVEETTSVQEIILKESKQTEVVFLGLAVPEPGHEEEYAERMESLIQGLGTVVFVKNSSMFIGDLIQ
ncbi:amino acid permease [bacterium]|nr:amino acid permease [candidate division CSSED10-310 bacterium]